MHAKFIPEDLRIEWKVPENCDDPSQYSSILLKVLRYCYGEDQSFTREECIVPLFIFQQLKLKCKDEISRMKQYILRGAHTFVELGAEMLCNYVMMHGRSNPLEDYEFAVALAETIMTPENLKKHCDCIVDRCLIELPPSFLSYIPHSDEAETRSIEYAMRRRYLQCNWDTLNLEEKKSVMVSCDGKKLKCEELDRLVAESEMKQM